MNILATLKFSQGQPTTLADHVPITKLAAHGTTWPPGSLFRSVLSQTESLGHGIWNEVGDVTLMPGDLFDQRGGDVLIPSISW